MTRIATPRERLLKTAAELFYAEGAAAVGVERLCRTAGVSKRSMYQLFTTKDEVIAESLRTYGPAAVAGYFPADPASMPARERILHVFARLEEQSAEPSFHGCPFVNTAVELHDPDHEASIVALSFKQRLEEYFLEHAKAMGGADPAFLAARLTMLFDGAAVRAVMRHEPLRGLALHAAQRLLDSEV
ncbi:TetR/AcrR family transcriptional regulator [Dactylosporangium vinaceum]|uniref:TetR/AcrR family transcriptional regulator n=1 Tax=Dactylosporangium vinaceum TaxID=53362 RepID=A0ABV5M1S1_9ACTN|nr:TetR/AcrR family transcriptional regulator [Dactylosporangium vinaceum]UAB99283.1 TetR/AcrR family transcriptional regulator [Dactylosporangium vinaceum]